MIPINVAEYSKYALSILFIFVIYISYLIVKPLVLTIITAIILVYVFSPVYNILNRRLIKNKYLCSLSVLIFVFFVLSIPVVFFLNAITQQGIEQYTVIKQFASDPTLFECVNGDTEFCVAYASLISQEDRSLLQDFLKNALLGIGNKITTSFFSALSSLPSRLLDFFVMLFLMFFLFMDGKKLFITVRNFLPMKLEHENYLIHTLKETTDAVVFGQVFIAILEGILAALGFWLIGIEHALLLGSFIAFLGVIPFFGPTLVWVPLSIYFIITGIQQGSLAVLGKGAIIAVFGVLVLSAIESLLKPKIIGDKAKLHPALVFVGVIGGLSLFGFIGFFLGPIILAVLTTLIKIYEKEKLIQLKK